MHDIHDHSECFAIFDLCQPQIRLTKATRGGGDDKQKIKSRCDNVKKSGVSNWIKQIVRCVCHECSCQNTTLYPNQSANSEMSQKNDFLSHFVSFATALLDDGVRVLKTNEFQMYENIHVALAFVSYFEFNERKKMKKEQENWHDVYTIYTNTLRINEFGK